MKITKYEHSCLLVEMPGPVNRTALFDPGSMSESVLDVAKLEYLDDIVITHIHRDHFSPELIIKLVDKFPKVRITTTPEVVKQLASIGIAAGVEPSGGIRFFDSPHENGQPLFSSPQQVGVHYLGLLSHPGDSHGFKETKEVLALPVTAPWGSTVKAVNLAIELKPKYVLPIHDWHWSDQARVQMYDNIERALVSHDITLVRLETGKPVVLDVQAA